MTSTKLPLWLIAKDHPDNTWSFIKQGVTEDDANSIGMSWSESNTFVIESHWNMAHIAHKMGIFPSVSQAKKNGWDIPIEEGFSEFSWGKKRVVFCFIWNPMDTPETVH